jgi:release factor glutamine methyltransferase
MPTVVERLRWAAARFRSLTETPRLDAEILLAHAMHLTRSQLLARLQDSCDAPDFDVMVEKRLAFMPLAYILGEWEFFSLPFFTEAPMLVPRPETEHLVETVLDEVGEKGGRVLDIGTGTGCVAVSIAKNCPTCHVTATDIRQEALDLARRNAERHGVGARITFRLGDLFAALPEDTERFKVICSNPPYVEEPAWEGLDPVIRLHEDPGALLAGPEGLDIIRRLVELAPRHLEPGGLLAFEMGMGQYEQVQNILKCHNYRGIRCVRDLAGIERIAVARCAE